MYGQLTPCRCKNIIVVSNSTQSFQRPNVSKKNICCKWCTSRKNNMDTQNDGLEKVGSFKTWTLLVLIS